MFLRNPAPSSFLNAFVFPSMRTLIHNSFANVCWNNQKKEEKKEAHPAARNADVVHVKDESSVRIAHAKEVKSVPYAKTWRTSVILNEAG